MVSIMARGRLRTVLIASTVFTGFFLTLATITVAHSREFKDVPEEQFDEFLASCQDGVQERIFHLSNPGAPVVVLEPGLGAKAMSLEIPATKFFQQGFDVYVGHWRGGSSLPEGVQALGETNGFKEVLRTDHPCHLRTILPRLTEAQRQHGIGLLGHSMGGMMIAGTLSDPALYDEFAPYIRGVVLYQSPHHVRYVRPYMRRVAQMALPLIAHLRAKGMVALDGHSKFMALSLDTKQNGSFFSRVKVRALEELAIFLTQAALSSPHTGRGYVRRAFFKMAAHSVPLDLLEDFARAVLGNGDFRAADTGEVLIRPEEAFKGIPVLMVSTRHDKLAPWDEQEEYFERINSPSKTFLGLEDMNHIDAILGSEEHVSYFHHIVDFMRDPYSLAAQGEQRVIMADSKCENWLRRITVQVKPSIL